MLLPDLIFVTDITDYIRGGKSVMWRNFRFLNVTNVEKSEVSPHVKQYEVCTSVFQTALLGDYIRGLGPV